MKKTSKFLAALAAFFLFAPAPIDAKVTDGDSVAVLGAVVDDGNSSTDALVGDAVYTGTGYDVTDYASITVFMATDVDSAENGLSMEFSTDNTNWDRAKKVTFFSADNNSQVHGLAVVAKFFRVVYTNGSSAQGHFRLQTLYHPTKPRDLTSSATQPMTDEDDVTFVRVSSSHDLDVARGIHAQQSWVNKFGHNPAVGTGAEEVIWSAGGEYTGFIQTADQIEVLSSDADDDSDGAGTNNGAQKVVISGLDGSWAEQQEEITLDGVGVATSTGTYFRVNRAWVTDVGACAAATPTTTCTNEGTITVRTQDTDTTVASIQADHGQSEMAIYTVPAGKTAYLREIAVTVAAGTNKDADVRMWQRRNVNDVSSPFTGRRIVWEAEDIAGAVVELFDYSVQFPEYTDIWFSGRGVGGTSAIDADFELLLVPNYTLPPAP